MPPNTPEQARLNQLLDLNIAALIQAGAPDSQGAVPTMPQGAPPAALPPGGPAPQAPPPRPPMGSPGAMPPGPPMGAMGPQASPQRPGEPFAQHAPAPHLAKGGNPGANPEDIPPVPHMGGLFNSPVPGRTDKLSVAVPAGGYVLPADVVSGYGEGNTLAGSQKFREMIKDLYGVDSGSSGAPQGLNHIIAAGGEEFVSPEAVKQIGGGDLNHGHDILDSFVKEVRAQTVSQLRSLPPPKA